jgi:hypothetical protein
MQQPAAAAPVKRLQGAEECFMQTRFAAAASQFRHLLQHPATAAAAHLRLGQIALLANRLPAAEAHLAVATQMQPSPAAWRAAAALFRRTARHAEAAACFAALGDTAAVAANRFLARSEPLWQVNAGEPLHLPFVTGRPIVRVQVNGRDALFLVDTGAEEVVVDEGLAADLGLALRGRQWALFAGGRRGQVGYGIVERLGLGGGTVSGVPAQTQPLRRLFQAAFAPLVVEGIIGTALLSRFRPCLDFRRGELRLDPRGTAAPAEGRPFRFWLAEAFLPLVSLRLQDGPPLLTLLDSGQERFGVALAAEVAAAAGLEAGAAEVGIGGGGAVPVWRAQPSAVELAGWRFERPSAVAVAQFPLAFRYGFHVAGAVGWDLLRRLAVSLDFDRMRIAIAA